MTKRDGIINLIFFLSSSFKHNKRVNVVGGGVWTHTITPTIHTSHLRKWKNQSEMKKTSSGWSGLYIVSWNLKVRWFSVFNYSKVYSFIFLSSLSVSHFHYPANTLNVSPPTNGHPAASVSVPAHQSLGPSPSREQLDKLPEQT